VSLGVGLPLQLFGTVDERRALRGRLQGLEALVSVDGEAAAALRIAEVRVFPQSAAAYFAAVAEAPELARRPCAVVDVGYRTTDHVLLRLAPGEVLARPDERASGSLDVGIERVYAEVAQSLGREHTSMVEPSAVEQAALSGVPMTLWGREVDARPLVEDASRHLAEEVAARLKEAWGGALGQVGVVLVAGGGGRALYPHLARTLPAPSLMAVPASANARGYAAMMAAATG
jgi:hypothetical protein